MLGPALPQICGCDKSHDDLIKVLPASAALSKHRNACACSLQKRPYDESTKHGVCCSGVRVLAEVTTRPSFRENGSNNLCERNALHMRRGNLLRICQALPKLYKQIALPAVEYQADIVAEQSQISDCTCRVNDALHKWQALGQ